MSKKNEVENKPASRSLIVDTSRRFIGSFANGQHTIHFTGGKVLAAALTVTGWQGGVNGHPVLNENVVTKSVQVVDDTASQSTVFIVFEVSGGQAEFGLQGIQYFEV